MPEPVWLESLEPSQREQAEAELRAMADALQIKDAIFENAPIGILIYRATGQCVAANEAAGKIVGATPAELTAMNFYEIDSWKRSGLFTAAREALDTGRPTHAEGELLTTFGVRLWMRTLFTSFQSQGEPHLMMMMEDVTERKRAADALRDSEERLRAVIETAPDGIFIRNNGRFEYANAAMIKMMGATDAHELLDSDPFDWVAPEYKDMVLARIQTIDETEGSVPPVDLEYLRLDGSRIPVESTAVRFAGDGDGVHLVFLRDRTERAKAFEERALLAEQLLDAQKMESVGLLAGGIAHDFNNILMVQRGYCEMMRLGMKDGDPMADGLTKIEEYAERATQLTRQLLAFGRKQNLRPVVIDLNYLMDDMEPVLMRLVGEGIRLTIVRSLHPPMVKADRSQMEQVLVNLAAYARDAMPQGGNLAIRIDWVDLDESSPELTPDLRPGAHILLSVGDTGPGMDPETARRVFEPFFATKGQAQAPGLGLPSVHGIVHQSGGDIRVESEPGKGTTFSVYLPRVENSLAMPTKREDKKRPGEAKLVLIVEDEPALRGIVTMMLEKLGYRTREASNGAEALALVERQGLRPDLVLTDVVMPEMSGTVLAENLRKHMPSLKVVYMSGYADETVLGHGVVGERVDFLRKPFSMADVAGRLEAVFGPTRR